MGRVKPPSGDRFFERFFRRKTRFFSFFHNPTPQSPWPDADGWKTAFRLGRVSSLELEARSRLIAGSQKCSKG